MKNKLSIIIPLFNEEEAIPYLYTRLIKVAEEIDNYDLELVSTDGYYETKAVFSPIYRLKLKKLAVNLNEGEGHLGL